MDDLECFPPIFGNTHILHFCHHVPHLFDRAFPSKRFFKRPRVFCPIKVLRRLGGDTSIQWHHWGSKNQDPKERSNFMNFASMASYSCILAASYLELKRMSSLKVEMRQGFFVFFMMSLVFACVYIYIYVFSFTILYLPFLLCEKNLQICRCFVCGTWIFTATLTRVLAKRNTFMPYP